MKTTLITLLACTMLVACQPKDRRVRTSPPPPPRTPSVAPEVASLHERALDVQTAPGARAEADAIKRLRAWIDSHDMTYTIQTRRASNDQPIEAASVLNEPVRAHLEIFRGRESLYRFEFTPKDNRNLALLGS